MTSMLAQAEVAGRSVLSITGIALVAYCLLSVGLLWAYARTRLYPVYLLKTFWITVTIVGFLWIVAMSFSDPGPKHGGVQSEFMKNPAGPFAALGHYPDWSRRIYGASPWWAAGLFVLLVLWRGLVGHPWSQQDSPRRRAVVRGFLAGTALLIGVVILLVDRRCGRVVMRYTAAGYFAVAIVAWVLLPMRLKRRFSAVALGILGVLAVVPLAGALSQFHWGAYTYAVRNYTFAWKTARMGRYVLNSLMVSVLTVGVTSLCASMAAYALARFEFKGRTAVLFGFIGAMVIPAQLYIVPLFLMIQNWHVSLGPVDFSFMDSRLGLALIYAAAGLPFAIFLLTGFYRTLPGTLREAAAIDGCGEWQIFTDVYFPLAAPGMATAAIFQFIGVWNEYQFALVFLTNDKLKTLPVGLYNLSVSQQYAANWSALFAGVTILCLPTFLIFVILQERIVAGLTVGAVKE